MKHYKYFILALAFVACKGEPSWRATETQVIHAHDEVMPYMGLMKRQQRELAALQSQQPTMADQCRDVRRQLVVGDSLMWWWMEQYVRTDLLTDSLTDDEIMDYLLIQRDYVDHVNHSMKSAIRAADELLGTSSIE